MTTILTNCNECVKRIILPVCAVLGLLLPAAIGYGGQFAPHASPTENTVMLLHLDETRGTTVVNDNHANFSDVGNATTVGSPTQGAGSVNQFFNTAYSTDASNYVELHYPDSDDSWNALSGNGSDYTFEAWVKWDVSGSGRQSVAEARLLRNGEETPYFWTFNLVPVTASTAQLNLTAQRLKGGPLESNVVDWDEDTWYHIAFTQKKVEDGDNEFEFFVTPETSDTYPLSAGKVTNEGMPYIPKSGGTDPPASLRIQIGTGQFGEFNGMIDETRISNTVLSNFPAIIPEPAADEDQNP